MDSYRPSFELVFLDNSRSHEWCMDFRSSNSLVVASNRYPTGFRLARTYTKRMDLCGNSGTRSGVGDLFGHMEYLALAAS